MTDAPTLSGRCSCGAVRYAVTGTSKWAAHCHCRDCRRASGAPYVTYVGLLKGQIAWSGSSPQHYVSSPGVIRTHCGTCGTPISYEGARWPDEIHVLAGTLDDPAAIKPQAHVYVSQKLPWVHFCDGLPRFRTVSSDGPPLAD